MGINYRFTLSLTLAIFLTACATEQLLPTGGPTTKQIWNGEYLQEKLNTENEDIENSENTVAVVTIDQNRVISDNQRLLNDDRSLSSNSSGHLQEINNDFKKVPNPQILGYVYPHFNESGLPVPGYFTAFRLYKSNHYALMHEGTGVSR